MCVLNFLTPVPDRLMKYATPLSWNVFDEPIKWFNYKSKCIETLIQYKKYLFLENI